MPSRTAHRWLPFLLSACVASYGQERAAAPSTPRSTPGKILFLGNSITLHSPAPNIGWTGNWGMAASAAEKDYVHLFVQHVQRERGTSPEYRVKNIADFERRLEQFDLATGLKDELAFQPDLVIIAIGENATAPTTDEEKARFLQAFRALLAAVRLGGHPTLLVRSCFWANPAKDEAMRQACVEAGGIFVDQSRLGAVAENSARSERTFEHAGVAGHPGDRGMRAIADSLWQAWRSR